MNCLTQLYNVDSLVTDKGTINQRAVLQNRAALVEELYAEPLSPRVLQAAGETR